MLTLCLSVAGYVLDAINLPTLVYDAIFGSLVFRFSISFYSSLSKKLLNGGTLSFLNLGTCVPT